MPRSGRKLKGKRDFSSASFLSNTAFTFQLPAPAAHALQACYPRAVDLLEVAVGAILTRNIRVAQVKPVTRSGRKLMGQRDFSSASFLGNTAFTFQLPAPAAHALQACYPRAIDRLEVAVGAILTRNIRVAQVKPVT